MGPKDRAHVCFSGGPGPQSRPTPSCSGNDAQGQRPAPWELLGCPRGLRGDADPAPGCSGPTHAPERRMRGQVSLLVRVPRELSEDRNILYRRIWGPAPTQGPASGTCLPPWPSEGSGCGSGRAFCNIKVRVPKLLLAEEPSCHLKSYSNSDTHNRRKSGWKTEWERGLGPDPLGQPPSSRPLPQLLQKNDLADSSHFTEGKWRHRHRRTCPRSPSPRAARQGLLCLRMSLFPSHS